MRVIKRNGAEVPFNIRKIIHAIASANHEVSDESKLNVVDVVNIAIAVQEECLKFDRAVGVEEIQDLVETELMKHGAFTIAQHYIRYRYEHALMRQRNTTDAATLSLVDYDNEEVKQENSNKNPRIIPTQRDYIAGEVSKDISKRMLLPQDVVEAHEEGIIHFHDMDYFIGHAHNCDLVNLEDMLQNGTVISGVMIEKPHMFSTACNIATQIIAQVASCQYGGQSITLAHLAPFVDESRQKFKREYAELHETLSDKEFDAFIEKLVKQEIKRGVQTIQYQVVTLMTTNG